MLLPDSHMYKLIKKQTKKIKRWMAFNPPGALSSKGWRLFEEEFKEKAPIRHYFNHTFPFKFMYPIKWKYEEITDWIRYRTSRRYHILDTGLKPGYYEVETKMLHVNFNMLKDFVEVEQAMRSYWWTDEYKHDASWCEKHMPFYRVFYPFRRPDLGIKHLEWAATLDDPSLPVHERCDSQAVSAREILKLYKWWIEERPARKEIELSEYDNQGLGILASLDDDFDKDADDYAKFQKEMDEARAQEEGWEAKDEEMLIRLVKIRRSLWS